MRFPILMRNSNRPNNILHIYTVYFASDKCAGDGTNNYHAACLNQYTLLLGKT